MYDSAGHFSIRDCIAITFIMKIYASIRTRDIDSDRTLGHGNTLKS